VLDHLSGEFVSVSSTRAGGRKLIETMAALDARMIREAIERNGGRRLVAAQEFDMHKRQLFDDLHRLGIDLPERNGRSHPGARLNREG